MLNFLLTSSVDDKKPDDSSFVGATLRFSSWVLIRSIDILRILKLPSYSYFFHSFFGNLWIPFNLNWTSEEKWISFSFFDYILPFVFSLCRSYWTRFHAYWIYLPFLWTFLLNFISLFICFTIIELILLYPFLFVFFWPHQAACRILVPWLEIEPGPLQWKCRVLIIGLPGSFQIFLYPLTFILLLSFFNWAILCGNHKNSFKFSGCSFFIATCSYFYGWTTL